MYQNDNMQDKNEIKGWFHKAVGNTAELKIECARATGIALRKIHRLYSGTTASVKHEDAVKILAFLNSTIVDDKDKISADELKKFDKQ